MAKRSLRHPVFHPRERADDHRAQAAGRDEISARFRAAWTNATDVVAADGLLLPERLARACTSVLPVDGASLGMIEGDLRVPLGASSDDARLAEQLQFTQGQGPCLEASRHGQARTSGPAQLEQRWPLYARELFWRTPYRAVTTLPLTITPSVHGALDLFFTEPATADTVSLTAATTVAERIVDALTIAQTLRTPATESAETYELIPPWLANPHGERRMLVWVAVGMAMSYLHTTAADSLALLRSYAYGNDQVLDDIADGIVNGSIDLTAL